MLTVVSLTYQIVLLYWTQHKGIELISLYSSHALQCNIKPFATFLYLHGLCRITNEMAYLLDQKLSLDWGILIGMERLYYVILSRSTFNLITWSTCNHAGWKAYWIHFGASTMDRFSNLLDGGKKPLQLLSCHTGVRSVQNERASGDSWYFSVTMALSIFDQTWVPLAATLLMSPQKQGQIICSS